MRKDRDKVEPPSEHAAGNGILNRRVFLERAMLTGRGCGGRALRPPRRSRSPCRAG